MGVTVPDCRQLAVSPDGWMLCGTEVHSGHLTLPPRASTLAAWLSTTKPWFLHLAGGTPLYPHTSLSGQRGNASDH